MGRRASSDESSGRTKDALHQVDYKSDSSKCKELEMSQSAVQKRKSTYSRSAEESNDQPESVAGVRSTLMCLRPNKTYIPVPGLSRRKPRVASDKQAVLQSGQSGSRTDDESFVSSQTSPGQQSFEQAQCISKLAVAPQKQLNECRVVLEETSPFVLIGHPPKALKSPRYGNTATKEQFAHLTTGITSDPEPLLERIDVTMESPLDESTSCLDLQGRWKNLHKGNRKRGRPVKKKIIHPNLGLRHPPSYSRPSQATSAKQRTLLHRSNIMSLRPGKQYSSVFVRRQRRKTLKRVKKNNNACSLIGRVDKTGIPGLKERQEFKLHGPVSSSGEGPLNVCEANADVHQDQHRPYESAIKDSEVDGAYRNIRKRKKQRAIQSRGKRGDKCPKSKAITDQIRYKQLGKYMSSQSVQGKNLRNGKYIGHADRNEVTPEKDRVSVDHRKEHISAQVPFVSLEQMGSGPGDMHCHNTKVDLQSPDSMDHQKPIGHQHTDPPDVLISTGNVNELCGSDTFDKAITSTSQVHIQHNDTSVNSVDTGGENSVSFTDGDTGISICPHKRRRRRRRKTYMLSKHRQTRNTLTPHRELHRPNKPCYDQGLLSTALPKGPRRHGGLQKRGMENGPNPQSSSYSATDKQGALTHVAENQDAPPRRKCKKRKQNLLSTPSIPPSVKQNTTNHACGSTSEQCISRLTSAIERQCKVGPAPQAVRRMSTEEAYQCVRVLHPNTKGEAPAFLNTHTRSFLKQHHSPTVPKSSETEECKSNVGVSRLTGNSPQDSEDCQTKCEQVPNKYSSLKKINVRSQASMSNAKDNDTSAAPSHEAVNTHTRRQTRRTAVSSFAPKVLMMLRPYTRYRSTTGMPQFCTTDPRHWLLTQRGSWHGRQKDHLETEVHVSQAGELEDKSGKQDVQSKEGDVSETGLGEPDIHVTIPNVALATVKSLETCISTTYQAETQVVADHATKTRMPQQLDTEYQSVAGELLPSNNDSGHKVLAATQGNNGGGQMSSQEIKSTLSKNKENGSGEQYTQLKESETASNQSELYAEDPVLSASDHHEGLSEKEVSSKSHLEVPDTLDVASSPVRSPEACSNTSCQTGSQAVSSQTPKTLMPLQPDTGYPSVVAESLSSGNDAQRSDSIQQRDTQGIKLIPSKDQENVSEQNAQPEESDTCTKCTPNQSVPNSQDTVSSTSNSYEGLSENESHQEVLEVVDIALSPVPSPQACSNTSCQTRSQAVSDQAPKTLMPLLPDTGYSSVVAESLSSGNDIRHACKLVTEAQRSGSLQQTGTQGMKLIFSEDQENVSGEQHNQPKESDTACTSSQSVPNSQDTVSSTSNSYEWLSEKEVNTESQQEVLEVLAIASSPVLSPEACSNTSCQTRSQTVSDQAPKTLMSLQPDAAYPSVFGESLSSSNDSRQTCDLQAESRRSDANSGQQTGTQYPGMPISDDQKNSSGEQYTPPKESGTTSNQSVPYIQDTLSPTSDCHEGLSAKEIEVNSHEGVPDTEVVSSLSSSPEACCNASCQTKSQATSGHALKTLMPEAAVTEDWGQESAGKSPQQKRDISSNRPVPYTQDEVPSATDSDEIFSAYHQTKYQGLSEKEGDINSLLEVPGILDVVRSSSSHGPDAYLGTGCPTGSYVLSHYAPKVLMSLRPYTKYRYVVCKRQSQQTHSEHWLLVQDSSARCQQTDGADVQKISTENQVNGSRDLYILPKENDINFHQEVLDAQDVEPSSVAQNDEAVSGSGWSRSQVVSDYAPKTLMMLRPYTKYRSIIGTGPQLISSQDGNWLLIQNPKSVIDQGKEAEETEMSMSESLSHQDNTEKLLDEHELNESKAQSSPYSSGSEVNVEYNCAPQKAISAEEMLETAENLSKCQLSDIHVDEPVDKSSHYSTKTPENKVHEDLLENAKDSPQRETQVEGSRTAEQLPGLAFRWKTACHDEDSPQKAAGTQVSKKPTEGPSLSLCRKAAKSSPHSPDQHTRVTQTRRLRKPVESLFIPRLRRQHKSIDPCAVNSSKRAMAPAKKLSNHRLGKLHHVHLTRSSHLWAKDTPQKAGSLIKPAKKLSKPSLQTLGKSVKPANLQGVDPTQTDIGAGGLKKPTKKISKPDLEKAAPAKSQHGRRPSLRAVQAKGSIKPTKRSPGPPPRKVARLSSPHEQSPQLEVHVGAEHAEGVRKSAERSPELQVEKASKPSNVLAADSPQISVQVAEISGSQSDKTASNPPPTKIVHPRKSTKTLQPVQRPRRACLSVFARPPQQVVQQEYQIAKTPDHLPEEVEIPVCSNELKNSVQGDITKHSSSAQPQVASSMSLPCSLMSSKESGDKQVALSKQNRLHKVCLDIQVRGLSILLHKTKVTNTELPADNPESVTTTEAATAENGVTPSDSAAVLQVKSEIPDLTEQDSACKSLKGRGFTISSPCPTLSSGEENDKPNFAEHKPTRPTSSETEGNSESAQEKHITEDKALGQKAKDGTSIRSELGVFSIAADTHGPVTQTLVEDKSRTPVKPRRRTAMKLRKKDKHFLFSQLGFKKTRVRVPPLAKKAKNSICAYRAFGSRKRRANDHQKTYKICTVASQPVTVNSNPLVPRIGRPRKHQNSATKNTAEVAMPTECTSSIPAHDAGGRRKRQTNVLQQTSKRNMAAPRPLSSTSNSNPIVPRIGRPRKFQHSSNKNLAKMAVPSKSESSIPAYNTSRIRRGANVLKQTNKLNMAVPNTLSSTAELNAIPPRKKGRPKKNQHSTDKNFVEIAVPTKVSSSILTHNTRGRKRRANVLKQTTECNMAAPKPLSATLYSNLIVPRIGRPKKLQHSTNKNLAEMAVPTIKPENSIPAHNTGVKRKQRANVRHQAKKRNVAASHVLSLTVKANPVLPHSKGRPKNHQHSTDKNKPASAIPAHDTVRLRKWQTNILQQTKQLDAAIPQPLLSAVESKPIVPRIGRPKKNQHITDKKLAEMAVSTLPPSSVPTNKTGRIRKRQANVMQQMNKLRKAVHRPVSPTPESSPIPPRIGRPKKHQHSTDNFNGTAVPTKQARSVHFNSIRRSRKRKANILKQTYRPGLAAPKNPPSVHLPSAAETNSSLHHKTGGPRKRKHDSDKNSTPGDGSPPPRRKKGLSASQQTSKKYPGVGRHRRRKPHKTQPDDPQKDSKGVFDGLLSEADHTNMSQPLVPTTPRKQDSRKLPKTQRNNGRLATGKARSHQEELLLSSRIRQLIPGYESPCKEEFTLEEFCNLETLEEAVELAAREARSEEQHKFQWNIDSSEKKKSTNSELHVGPSSSNKKRRSKRSSRSPEGSYWDCSVCTYRNKAEAFKCAMCDVRKGTSTRKPRLNAQLVAQQQAQQNLSPLIHVKPVKPSARGPAQRKAGTAKKPRPRLKNIDRSSAVSTEVVVNNVPVIITEYKEKSHTRTTVDSDDASADRTNGNVNGL